MNLNFCEIGEMTDEELLQVYCLAPQALENKFTGSDWADFLESKPEFAIHCEWHKLNGKNWCRLLMRHPEFAEHCNWDKLSGSDWSELLSVQPKLAQRCDWDKLDSSDWMKLLSDRPEFAKHCDWDKLNASNWVVLLSDRPEFAKHCDWKKLSSWDWVKFLASHPEFAKHCDWDKLDGWDWLRLLNFHPEFAEFCNSDSLNNIYRNTWWPYVPPELGAKFFRFDLTPLTRIRWTKIKEIKMSMSRWNKPPISVTSFLFASWLRSSDNFSSKFKFAFQPIFLLHRKFSKKDRNKYDFPTESPGEFWIQYDIARDLYKKHFQALLTHHKWKMLEKLLQLDAQKFIQVLPFKTLFLPLLFAAPESLIMNVIKAYENNVKKKIAEFHDKRGNNMLHYLFVRLLDECPAWVFNPPEEYRVMEEFLIANGADPAEKNLMQLSYLDCMEYFRSALQEQKC